MILVQCVMTNEYEADTNTANKKPRLPKNMPNCMYRRLVNIRKEDAATTGEDFQPNFAGTKRSARSPQRTTTQQRQQRQTQPQLEQPGSIQSAACYMDISDAFYERDKAKLEELQTEYHDILAADGNVGLVQQCHTQLVRNQVAHLSKMYSVVPLKKLAELLKIPDDQVTKILCQSAVLCEVQADGMVVFADPRANEKPRSTVDIMEWMHLLDKVQELDIGIATTARYHSLVRKESSNSGDTKAVVAGPRGVEDF